MTRPGVGTNRYAYAGGDPVNGSDPGGNFRIGITLSGEITTGVGIAGGMEISITMPWFGGDNTEVDLQISTSVGGRAGYLVGAGAGFVFDPNEIDPMDSALEGDLEIIGQISTPLATIGESNSILTEEDDEIGYLEIETEETKIRSNAPVAGVKSGIGISVGMDASTTVSVRRTGESAARAVGGFFSAFEAFLTSVGNEIARAIDPVPNR